VAEAKSGLQGATSRLSKGVSDLSGAAEAAKAALKKLR
jgi:hypothetical protein